ncbi:T9SS type A sorting domain-containing protein [Algibacter sp. L3A6]|uniref:T9SS type A sorting domain-containing protein n=1 Tax=Algibacter sp. L3A6 TaxID=2686366 RepID=UPI003977424E
MSPNPINDSFSIVKNSIEKIKSIQVFNLRGVLVKSYKGVQDQYNISELRSGLYLATIKTENNIKVVILIKE